MADGIDLYHSAFVGIVFCFSSAVYRCHHISTSFYLLAVIREHLFTDIYKILLEIHFILFVLFIILRVTHTHLLEIACTDRLYCLLILFHGGKEHYKTCYKGVTKY